MGFTLGEMPTRDNCDPNDPREAFLWMLIALPGMKGAPVPWPIEYFMEISERLWNCGARPGIGEQTIWYNPPQSGDISPMFAAGAWEDHPPEVQDLGIDLKSLGMAVQREVRRQALELEPDAPTEVEAPATATEPAKWPEKIRVHYLAKKLGSTSADVLAVCAEIGVPAKSAQSSIPGNRCAAIRDQLRINALLAQRPRPGGHRG